MPASATLSLRIRSDVREKLERIARDQQCSKSSLAAAVLTAYVEGNIDSLKGLMPTRAPAGQGAAKRRKA